MNDFRLLALKHVRVMAPLFAATVVLAGVRLLSDALAVQQIYGVGVLLLSVAMTIYALDSVVRLTGLGDDRLLLLSPTSRWALAAQDVFVLALFLVIGYVPTMPAVVSGSAGNSLVPWLDLAGFIVSVFTGLGLMLAIAYALKRIRRRSAYTLVSWSLYSAVIGCATVACISVVTATHENAHWLLGVTSSDDTVNIYAAVLPIIITGIPDTTMLLITFAGCNVALGLLFWASGALLSRRANNFLRLS